LLDSIQRLGSIRYKVDLLDRKDSGVLAPTWISVPCFTDRIDVLEVHWRLRNGKTSSIATSVGDSERYMSNGFDASLALLQRFIERGIYLLSKKKRQKIHIGVLEIHLNAGAELDKVELDEFAEEVGSFLDDYLVGEMDSVYDSDEARHSEARQREVAQFEMLAGKIDRIQIHEELARREELARNSASGGADEPNVSTGDIAAETNSSIGI
jgi:hypothetical protein